jgi:signal-transduction protein with cAMP-binding, CBS, and nucleotidyltransferase domain
VSLRESLDDAVSKYASSSFVTVSASDSVAHAARIMQEAGATEAIVVKDSVPEGIVTERDILYKVVATGENPSLAKVRDIMSTPVQTIDEGSKVGEAIARMSKLGMRRLAVTRGGKIIGMITQKAMVTGSVETSIPLPELAPPSVLACPYCNAIVKTREELSKHIDQSHMGGLGLLQGDFSKW